MDTEVCKASLRLGKDSGLRVPHVMLFTRDVRGWGGRDIYKQGARTFKCLWGPGIDAKE
jgi:hypothetical protein